MIRHKIENNQNFSTIRGNLRSTDTFPVVASLPPKNFGGREATTGNVSALRRLHQGLLD